MAESRTANSAKNVAWGVINIVVGILIGFVNRTVFIQILGAEYLGINGLFSNILTVLSLADLGFGTAMAYSYYKPIAENDTPKIIALNHFYKKIYTFVALAITVVGLALIPFLKSIINLEEPVEHLYLYYVLTLAGTVSSYLLVYKSTLINAYQKNYIVTRYNSLFKILIAVAQIIFMYVTKSYVVYLVIVLIGNIVNNLRVSYAADKMFPFIKGKGELDRADKRSIFQNVKSMFIYKMSSVLINGTDNIIISAMVGTVYVGYYSNYLMIINYLTNFINTAFTSLTASIGNLVVTESKEKRFELFKTVQVLSFWFSMVIAPCVFALFNEFIVTWVGAEYLLSTPTVIAIVFNLYLTCVLQPIWIYREATGIYMKTKYIMLATALLNIVLSVWWGWYFGIAGILFASATSKLLTYVWYEPILLFKDFLGTKPWEYFLPALLNLIGAAAISAALYLLVGVIPLTGWLGFIVKGIVCFGIANVVYLLCFVRNRYFKFFASKIFGLLKRLKK